MATVFTASCDGVDQATTSVADAGFPYTSILLGAGSTVTYDAANKMEGTAAVKFVGAANVTATAKLTGLTATRRVMRRYWRLPVAPSATGVVLTRLRDGGAVTLASLNLDINGHLLIRDRTTTRWTSTGVYTNNAALRTVFTVDSTALTIRVDIYIGTNLNGTTPDETSGVQVYTTATIAQVEDGMGTAQGVGLTYTMYMDAVLDDDTADPGGLSSALLAALTVSPTSGTVPFTVTATASATGGTGTVKNYAFVWGDGGTTASQTAVSATHSYVSSGSYTVTVTVTNT